MRIRVIVGREGRLHINKSDYIYEEIGARLQRGRSKMYLVVPEQFTLGAERELMAYNRLPGLLGADVLSFKRLEYRVLSEVGGIAKTFVDEHGKQMLLQKSIREVQKELSVYRRSAGKLGFLENICAFISELKQSEITPEDLETAESEVGEGRILSQKLKDIRKIYGAYTKLLGGERIDGDDRAKLLCAQIPKSDYLERSLIWIDGFHTFS
ncbi:MAG: PD-(D/E)XK nuclease family protein, partial [Eubacterium callanderi]